jgi:hypothetical protein
MNSLPYPDIWKSEFSNIHFNIILQSTSRSAKRGSVLVKALCYKMEGWGLKRRCSEFIFFLIYLIPQAAIVPGVYSASNRNKYQKQKMFLGSRARPVHNADNLTAICKPIV